VCLYLGTAIAGGTEDREMPCWRTVKRRVLVAGRHDVLEYNRDNRGCGDKTALACVLTLLDF
jgi:hypothetical protein